MLSLRALADLADAHTGELDKPVAPLRIAGTTHDLDAEPMLMGVVNLSRDSTYRDSVAVSTASAVRRARIQYAQGAGLVDIGAESTTLRADRVGEQAQVQALVPVVEALAAEGIPTSVEASGASVVAACLAAGANVVNLTAGAGVEPIYELAAAHDAAVVLCFVPNATVRDIAEVTLDRDPLPLLEDWFGRRLEHARAHGVTELVIDPGLGFFYANLTDPLTRARHQAQVLLSSFRLRSLGVPICQALPHAFDLFEEEFRTAEGFFAVLARLGRVNLLRTHEVARVGAVLRSIDALG
ncbi:MAG: dihydropteroate synthase [Candidatus Nanopelagicales bacterium]|jgi:dihydropteroate synthase|nr:dihydropteroate synthase [Candidatus Nanopelagicales bacterium]